MCEYLLRDGLVVEIKSLQKRFIVVLCGIFTLITI